MKYEINISALDNGNLVTWKARSFLLELIADSVMDSIVIWLHLLCEDKALTPAGEASPRAIHPPVLTAKRSGNLLASSVAFSLIAAITDIMSRHVSSLHSLASLRETDTSVGRISGLAPVEDVGQFVLLLTFVDFFRCWTKALLSETIPDIGHRAVRFSR